MSLNLFFRLFLKLSAWMLSFSLLWFRSLSLSKLYTLAIFSLMLPFCSTVFRSSSLLHRYTRQMIMLVKLWGRQPSPSELTISRNTRFDFSERAHRLNILQSIYSRSTSTESQSWSRSSIVMGMPQLLNMSQTSSLESPPEPSMSNSWKICSMEVSLTSCWGKQRQLLFLRFSLWKRVRSHLMKEAVDSRERLLSASLFFYCSIIIKGRRSARLYCQLNCHPNCPGSVKFTIKSTMNPLRHNSLATASNGGAGEGINSSGVRNAKSPLDRIRQISNMADAPANGQTHNNRQGYGGTGVGISRTPNSNGVEWPRTSTTNTQSQSPFPIALTATTTQANSSNAPMTQARPNSPAYPESQPNWEQQPNTQSNQSAFTTGKPQDPPGTFPGGSVQFHQQQSQPVTNTSSGTQQQQQQQSKMMMPQDPKLFSQFNFQPQPNYQLSVFSESAMKEIRSLLLRKQSITYFVCRQMANLVDRNLARKEWETESPEIEQVFREQPEHREVITLYRRLVELRRMLTQFKKETNYKDSIVPMSKEDRMEGEVIWQAMKNYYDSQLNEAYYISGGRMTEELLGQSEAYEKNKLAESEETFLTGLKELSYLKDYKQKGLVPPSSSQLGFGDLSTNYGYFDDLEALRYQEIDYFAKKAPKPVIKVIVADAKQEMGRYKRREEERKEAEKAKVIRLSKDSTKTPKTTVIVFDVLILWTDCNDETYKTIKGYIELRSKPSVEKVIQLLTAHVKAKYHAKIRMDASWEYSKMKKIEPSTSWQVSLVIRQRMINLPPPYSCSRESTLYKRCLVEGLTITNSWGSVFWKGRLEVETIDFSKEVIEVDEDGICCNHPGLNSPCLVTFFALPPCIRRVKEDIIQERLHDHLANLVAVEGFCALEWVDWKQGHYTVGFKTFGEFDRSDEVEEAEREQDRLNSALLKIQEELKVLTISSEVQHE